MAGTGLPFLLMRLGRRPWQGVACCVVLPCLAFLLLGCESARDTSAHWIWSPPGPVPTHAVPDDPGLARGGEAVDSIARERVRVPQTPPDDSAPRNGYLLARREIDLAQPATSAMVRVTADSRYALYVNGAPASRGPARGRPERQPIDSVDLLPLLPDSGPVVLALVVHHYGLSTFQYEWRARAGVYLEGEITTPEGAIPLHTNRTWRVSRATPWDEASPRINAQQGFQEYHDARKVDPDWMLPGFDDGAWHAAREVGTAGCEPWTSFEPRGIPLLEDVPRQPAVVGAGYLRDATPVAWNAAYRLTDAMATALPNPPAGARPRAIVPDDRGDPYLLLDMGRVLYGRVTLRLAAQRGGEEVEIGYGERLVDGRLLPSWPPDRDRARYHGVDLADRYICRAGEQEWQSFSPRGFRYLLLAFRGLDAPLDLLDVGVLEETYPARQRGDFACSDPVLTEIWHTGVRTLRACMGDAYMDCPWREQAQWLGDALVSARINQVSLGEGELMARLLRQAPQRRTEDGLFTGVFPMEAPERMHFVLPTYCLLWIVAQWEWYAFTGDASLLDELFDDTVVTLAAVLAQRGPDGLLRHDARRHWLFIDSEGLPPPDWAVARPSASYHLMLIWALETAAHIATALEKPQQATDWRGQAQSLREVVLDRFHDADTELLCEALDEAGDPWIASAGMHPAALALLARLSPRDDARWVRQLERANLREVGELGGPASAYFHAFVLDALCRAGHTETAVEWIRQRWGDLLAREHTTWPEFWDERGTLCHAWSGAPTAVLSRRILGVEPITPGGATVLIHPEPAGLAWARGAVPFPKGEVEVAWTRAASGIIVSVTLPRGMDALLGDGRRLASGPHTVRVEPGTTRPGGLP